MAYDDAHDKPRPVVMLVPAFEGLVDTYRAMARRIAQQGYVAAVVDMYGDGRTSHDWDECLALLNPFTQDRAFFTAPRDRSI